MSAWKTRNAFVHGRDTIEQRQYASYVYEKRVRDCYEYLPQLCGDDRHMFDASATDTLSKPPHQIETWLTMVEALIKQNKKENLEGK